MKNIKNIMIVGSLVAALCSNLALADTGITLGPQFVCESTSAISQQVGFGLRYKDVGEEGKPKSGNFAFNGRSMSDCELTWGDPWMRVSGMNHSFTVDLATIYCRGPEANVYIETDQGPSVKHYEIYHPTPSNKAQGRSVGTPELVETYNNCKYSGAVLF